jgi:hypothetical protein
MTKNERRKGFLVALVIAILAAAVAMNQDARDQARHWRDASRGYYAQLDDACQDDCCRSSVDTMRRDHALAQPADGCPAGESAEMLRCASSYRWCEAR